MARHEGDPMGLKEKLVGVVTAVVIAWLVIPIPEVTILLSVLGFKASSVVGFGIPLAWRVFAGSLTGLLGLEIGVRIGLRERVAGDSGSWLEGGRRECVQGLLLTVAIAVVLFEGLEAVFGWFLTFC